MIRSHSREDKTARVISILMRLANAFDEKGLGTAGDVTITNWDVGLGYRALTGDLRAGIEHINNLQDKVYSLKEKVYFQKMDIEDRIYIEDLSEENQEKARAYVEKLRDEEMRADNEN